MAKKLTEFGKLCRSYRAMKGMNMTDIVKKTEKPQSAISRIEQGEAQASLEYIRMSIDAYEIKEKAKQKEFLLSYLNSTEKFEIPLKELGPIMKEMLAAFCILGEISEEKPSGWNDLIDWAADFAREQKKRNPLIQICATKLA
jgi:transcriptional regulator with XRE-family HTH domain